MIDPADAIAALTIGVMGSTHCAVMCGGIAGALGVGVKERQSKPWLLLGFQIGRIGSYTFIGLMLGGIAAYAGSHMASLSTLLRLIAGGLLIAMGLYIADWWRGAAYLERIGAPVWSRIQPAASRLLPVTTMGGALSLGALWGWLPCGLVYSTLGWAISADESGGAAMRMAFFGLGTLPAMLTMSFAANATRQLLQRKTTRHVAGILLILFGLWTLVTPLQQLVSDLSGGVSGHHHH